MDDNWGYPYFRTSPYESEFWCLKIRCSAKITRCLCAKLQPNSDGWVVETVAHPRFFSLGEEVDGSNLSKPNLLIGLLIGYMHIVQVTYYMYILYRWHTIYDYIHICENDPDWLHILSYIRKPELFWCEQEGTRIFICSNNVLLFGIWNATFDRILKTSDRSTRGVLCTEQFLWRATVYGNADLYNPYTVVLDI